DRVRRGRVPHGRPGPDRQGELRGHPLRPAADGPVITGPVRADPEREYTQAAPDAQIRCASAGCTDPSAARAPVHSHVIGFEPELEIPLCASCYSRWNDKHGDDIDQRAVTWLIMYRHGQWWTEADWQ